MAQFANRAVLVVREDVNDHRGAAGPVTLILRLFVRHARFFAGSAADRTLDVVRGHVARLGLGNDRAQTRVHVGITAAIAGCNRQFFDDAGEDLAALGVSGAFLMLDRVPL